MTEARIINGKALAAGLRERVAKATAALKAEHGLVPGLAVVLVGDDPASRVYVAGKAKQSKAAGMKSFEVRLPADTSEAEILARVAGLNTDGRVHGILVQLPLPGQVNESTVTGAIDPAKDVDGLSFVNMGRLAAGAEGLVPCTPLGCLMLLKDTLADMTGLKAMVVGRSKLVGKPMAQLLLAENCTVTTAHSRTRDLAAECTSADILVAAVGRAEMVRGDWIKPGATVIDVGINRLPAGDDGQIRLVGDVCFREAVKVAGAITPVPGGVGPMTIACLLSNTLSAACRQAGVAVPDIA